MHHAAVAAFHRPANYWHMLPEAAQARKAIWEAVNPHTGRRRIDEAFPDEICSAKRDTDMVVRFLNGATWQVVGSDNFNSLVGATPVGITFSEWAIANASAWGYMRPILLENGGWAHFITTPRGKNHAYTMLQAAQADPAWLGEVLAAEETGVFTPEQLAGERAEYVREYGEDVGAALFDQEYSCSFDAAILGSYWGADLRRLEREGRLTTVPIDPALPVHTAWDLGVGDSTAIWLWQASGPEVRVVDFYESHGVGLDHYAKELEAKREAAGGWRWGHDWVPHDAKVKELGTGRTRVETLIGLGRRPRLVPGAKLDDGINAARQIFSRTWFDSRCSDAVEGLKAYRRDYDEQNRVYRDRPKHDWTSHRADAFRYLALAWREIVPEVQVVPGRRIGVGPHNEVTFDDLWQSAPEQRRRV